MKRLNELLLEWEERRDRGDPVTPEVLCAAEPDLLGPLIEHIGHLEAFEAFILGSEAQTAPAADGPTPVPARIGQYEIVEEVGRGGMGVVYKGYHALLDRHVAVKTISPRRFGSPSAEHRFVIEGRALARFKNDHIVGVHDAGTYEGRAYLVMEYVPGGNLEKEKERLRRDGPLAVTELLEKVARAVHYAHTHTVPTLHRDLKPLNILLTETGEPKVADFGLAKLFDADPPAAVPADIQQRDTPPKAHLTTVNGQQPGTPGYMAPEAMDPSLGPPTAAIDVWALGVILHEVLTGKRPNPAIPPDPNLVAEAVPGPTGRRLAAVVARCLRRSPAERYPTAAALADALATVRRPPRWPWLAGLAVVACLVGLAVARPWVGKPPDPAVAAQIDPEFDGYTDPEAVKAALAKLAAGEAVVLIDKAQPAPAYRLNLGSGSGRVVHNPVNGTHVAANKGICLVELLPYLPPGNWVIEARVRHESDSDNDQVGIFAAGRRARSDEGWENVYFTVGFTRRVPHDRPTTKGDHAATRVQHAWQSRTLLHPGLSNMVELWEGGAEFVAPNPADPRELGIAVTDVALTGSLDRKPFGPCSPTRFEEALARFVKQPRTVPAELTRNFHGGVGLHCRFGQLTAESFVVRPRK